MRAEGSNEARRKIWAEGFGRTLEPANRAANQVAAPINRRLEGIASLAVPGGIAYVTGKHDDPSWTRTQQRKFLDLAGDSSRDPVMRSGAGVVGLALQPFAI